MLCWLHSLPSGETGNVPSTSLWLHQCTDAADILQDVCLLSEASPINYALLSGDGNMFF